MASFSSAWLMSFLVVLALFTSPVKWVVQCKDIVPELIPWESFLLNASPMPSAECCDNAQEMDKLAVALVPERKALCKCLTSIFKYFPIDYNRASLTLQPHY